MLVAAALTFASVPRPTGAALIVDPVGDFLPTYTGPQDPGLDVLTHHVTLSDDRLIFFGQMAGPIAPTQAIGGLYLFGVDRGMGTPRFLNSPAAPPIIGPNVLWDAIVRINANGTGAFVNSLIGVTTTLDPLDITISGNEITARVPLSLMLTAATRPPEQWTYNLWPRNGVGLNVQVSDLAPDDDNSPVHVVPEPATCGVVCAGLAVLGLSRRRARQRAAKRPGLELLESRRLLSALTVSSAADSGIGSLRDQIAAAQSGDSINFAPGLAGQTITLTSGSLSIAKDLAIQGLGADRLTISGNDASLVFWIIGSTSNVQIRDLTITRGSPAIANAGVLSVSNCTLTANVSNYGGAISNSGTLNLSGSTLAQNSAIGYNNYALGGAIYSGAGAVTVSNCTIANNSALGGQVVIYDPDSGAQLGIQGYDAYGGGLYVAGGTASIDHSTLAGNYASGGYSSEGLPVAAGYGGAISGVAQVSNSIIAGNHADYSPDGGFTSLGHNLIGNSIGGGGFAASDLLDVNPQLGPFQNNGGATRTMALLPGSPAVNAGDNTNAPAYDQRGAGFPRIVGGAIDIGAFESDNGPDYTGLRIHNVTATEGNTGAVNAAVTVTLSAPAISTVTVNFATSDGSATVAGGDYDATSGTLTFSPGQTSKTILIPVKGDRIVEGDEQFYLNLSGAANAYLFDPQGVVTIVDDEPRVSIGNASVTEGNSGTTAMTFTVTLAAAYDVATSVNFSTASGNAIAGNDFDATSGTVTFLPGQTSKTLSVPVLGDGIDEYDETFTVSLSGTTNLVILDAEGTATIVDDDAPPAIVISDASRAEGNSGTTAFAFTVSKLTPSEKTIFVQYSTANGSATSSTAGNKQDYQPISQWGVHLYPDSMSGRVFVYVIGDTRSENDETFFVNLSQPVNATIADAQGTGTILNDDGGRGKNWVGPTSGGSWGTAANWSPSGVPTGDSLVLISDAAVTVSASALVSEISLGADASLIVAAAGNRVLRTKGLYFGDNSRLNLNDNAVIIDYTGATPIAAIGPLLASGYNGGAWNGNGIGSSVAASSTNRALGYAEATDQFTTFPAVFSGQSIDNTALLIRFTLPGDATLDQSVNIADFSALATNFNVASTRWSGGNFNYDGSTNIGDLGILGGNFNQSIPAGLPRAASATLPMFSNKRLADEIETDLLIDLVA